MRPVNLIPKDERSGVRRAMRSGPLAYIVLGGLLAALAAMTVLVVTDNQIADSKAEITRLNAEIADAQARAAESAAYTQFHLLAEQRATTVTNLADSRFDWERVMRELALILPGDIWLTNLSASVKPGLADSSGSGLRDGIAGPALQLNGCGVGQESVARFVSSLKEIEGVTRVGVQSSALTGSDSAGGSSSATANCEGGDFIAQFQLVVAFDAAPIPTTGAGSETEVVAAAPEAEAPSESTETSSEGEG
jgi:Tfp pilus assembly protein PilN